METYPDLRVVVWAARQAGDALMSHSPSREELSGSTGGTTESDLAAERIIVGLISGTFPDHNTNSEESSPTYMTKPRWIIDPFNGTANFGIGAPYCAVSIAFETAGMPDVRVVYHVPTNTMFTGSRAVAHTRMGNRCRSRKPTLFPRH